MTFEEAGIYNVSQTINGCNAASASEEAFLTVHALPAVVIDTPTEIVCIETGINLTAMVNGPNITTFEWMGEGIENPNAQTTLVMPNSGGTYEYSVMVTDDFGCSNQAISTVEFDICGSVNELATLYSLQVFPNPNQGAFVVSMDLPTQSEVRLELMNVLGQNVVKFFDFQASRSFEQQVSLEGLASGMYYLVIEVDGEQMVEKVVVE